jgi:hypothetical protein
MSSFVFVFKNMFNTLQGPREINIDMFGIFIFKCFNMFQYFMIYDQHRITISLNTICKPYIFIIPQTASAQETCRNLAGTSTTTHPTLALLNLTVREWGEVRPMHRSCRKCIA